MSADYRISVYLGAGDEGAALRALIDAVAKQDKRFNKSPQNFVRYATRYALENDASIVLKDPETVTK